MKEKCFQLPAKGLAVLVAFKTTRANPGMYGGGGGGGGGPPPHKVFLEDKTPAPVVFSSC